MGSQLATLVERTEVRVAAAEVRHTSLEPQTSRQGARQVCHSHVEPCLGQAAADEARRERDAAEMALQVQRLDADADVGASADALSRNARPIEPS